jgi:hypothetical protein
VSAYDEYTPSRISIRALSILLAALDARIGSHIHVHLDLEAVIGRGEDDCVVDVEVSLTGELAPRLDEADVMARPLELHPPLPP